MKKAVIILKTKQAQAILAILISAILFTIMGAFVKALTPNLPTIEVVFARNLFGLLWIIVALLIHPPKEKQGGKPFILFLRGFAGGSAMLAYFYNIAVLPMGTAYAFSYTSPIFLAFLSMIFIHTHVSIRVWVAIFLGFSGVLFISNPQAVNFSITGFLIGIYSGLGAALAYLSIAKLTKNYDSRVIIGSLMFWGTILVVITQFFPYEKMPIALFEPFVLPNFKEFLLILLLGVVSTYAQIYLTRAYTLGNPPLIGAISYITILFATIMGIVMGDSIPNLLAICGMILIILGGILAAFRHAK